MTVLFTLLFAVRGIFNLIYSWGIISKFYPESMNPVFWDAIVRNQSLIIKVSINV